MGQALQKSSVPRHEIFLTTKAYIPEMGYQATLKAFENSCQKLGTDYLDLYLIHMPLADYYGSWRALEQLYHQGRIRAIVVCNFSTTNLLDLSFNFDIQPMINQIETHPLFQRTAELDFMKQQQIQPEAWAPFAEGRQDIFHDQRLQTIAFRHHKSTAQVILRWNIQRCVVIIPKSVHETRMQENLDIWDFALTDSEMKEITNMDLKHPQMLDLNQISEVRRVYDYLNHPVLTTL